MENKQTMQTREAMKTLIDLGYQLYPQALNLGGPFYLLSPEGSIIWENDFVIELEKNNGQKDYI